MLNHKGQGVHWTFPVLSEAAESDEINKHIFFMQAQISSLSW
jgi:hypothetical protein